MTLRRGRVAVAVAATALVAVLAVLPVRADTAGDLNDAKARLAAVQANLDHLAARYAAAQTRYAQTQAHIDDVRARMTRVRARMAAIQQGLSEKAREAYESGGAGTIELLLSSQSLAQFADRVEFIGRMSQDGSDLLTQAQVTGEQLRRDAALLAHLSIDQAANIKALADEKAAIAKSFAQEQALVSSLTQKLAKERAAAAAAAAEAAAARARIVSAGPLNACPVGQPRAYTDDFGDPRPGGRTHQGIDMLAPLGTPIYAAQPGRFVEDYNDLGGISALVYADDGDFTYYAHMSRYAGVLDGSTVAAGTMIGHVGNTGDAQGGPYHLHFEYHPGGGGAVDPYDLLVAVCG